MCICCLVIGASSRFPFVLASVRDEMLARPTGNVRVHPLSHTACCLDESLPPSERGSWLAVNAALGTFAILTNADQPGRPEPARGTVPSRGLLVMNAVEAQGGRISEPTLAVRESWNSSSSPPSSSAASASASVASSGETGGDSSPRVNALCAPDRVAPLNGFNLLAGSLRPGGPLDVRYTTNLFGKQFDQSLLSSSPGSVAAGPDATPRGGAWALSNSWLDNPNEPRLAFLKERVLCVLRDESVLSPAPPAGGEHAAATTTTSAKGRDGEDDGGRSAVSRLADALGTVLLSRPNFSDADLPVERLNLSDAMKARPVDVAVERQCQRNIASYAEWYAPSSSATSQRGAKLRWGTRTHSVVIVEDAVDVTSGTSTATPTEHFFVRDVAVVVDDVVDDSDVENASSQPPHSFAAGEWTHLRLPCGV